MIHCTNVEELVPCHSIKFDTDRATWFICTTRVRTTAAIESNNCLLILNYLTKRYCDTSSYINCGQQSTGIIGIKIYCSMQL